MIQIENTPNPDSIKFLSEKTISVVGTEEFKKEKLNEITIFDFTEFLSDVDDPIDEIWTSVSSNPIGAVTLDPLSHELSIIYDQAGTKTITLSVQIDMEHLLQIHSTFLLCLTKFLHGTMNIMKVICPFPLILLVMVQNQYLKSKMWEM